MWIVAAVYGGTYFAKNFADVLIERRGLSESRAAGTAKFCATTATNMGGSILKDAAFARWFGAAAAAAAAPAVIPKTSYALFAARDCLTISGAFVVPDAMRAALHARAGVAESAAGVVSQLVSPPLMQVVCTPLHLLALNLVNVPAASAAARVAALRASTPAALLARSLPMLPAHGVGGLLNAVVTAKGRDVVAAVFAERSYKRLGHAMGTMSFGAFGRKTSAAGAASSSGEVSRRRRSVAGAPAGAARRLPAGTDARAAQVREHHACDGGCGGSNPNDGSGHGGGGRGARGSGNGRGGMGGAERTVSTKEVVGGGRGGGAEHLRAVGEVGGRAARERRGRMTRDSRVAGSFDAFVRRPTPSSSNVQNIPRPGDKAPAESLLIRPSVFPRDPRETEDCLSCVASTRDTWRFRRIQSRRVSAEKRPETFVSAPGARARHPRARVGTLDCPRASLPPRVSGCRLLAPRVMGSGGAGGPGFVPRTVEQLESVPPAVDALVGVASGAVAGLAVSPFLMSVDRAVVAAAAGTAPGGSLFRAIAASAAEFVTNPRAAFANPALSDGRGRLRLHLRRRQSLRRRRGAKPTRRRESARRG